MFRFPFCENAGLGLKHRWCATVALFSYSFYFLVRLLNFNSLVSYSKLHARELSSDSLLGGYLHELRSASTFCSLGADGTALTLSRWNFSPIKNRETWVPGKVENPNKPLSFEG